MYARFPPLPKGRASASPSLAFCDWVVLSLRLSFRTRARNQGVRAKTAHQLSTLNLDLWILKGGWRCPGQRVREVGGRGCSSPGSSWTELVAGAGEGRGVPGLALGGPSLSLLSPPPRACPSRSGGAVSSPCVSGALSIVSAFTTGSRGRGRRAGAGPPHPRLSWGRLPSSGCACLRLLLFSSRANSPAEQPASEPDPSLWAPPALPALPPRLCVWE